MAHAGEIDLSIPDNHETKRPTRCHLMPCSIEHDQLEVRAGEYFEPTIRKLKTGDDDEQGRNTKQPINQGDDILMASFRGRPLMGKKIELPNGYVGHAIGTGKSTGKVKKHFSEFTCWNWDQMPDKNDPPVRALNWMRVSKSIHDPID